MPVVFLHIKQIKDYHLYRNSINPSQTRMRQLAFKPASTSSLSLFNPYSDYVGVNISLNNCSLLSFFNVYAPLFAPPQRMAEPTSFLPPPEIFSFWGTLYVITLSGTQEILPTPRGGSIRLVISSDFLPHNNSDALTLLHCSSGTRSSLDIFFALFSLALSCSREVLQDLGPNQLAILLSVPLFPAYSPNERPLTSIFRELAGMVFSPTLTLTVLEASQT